MQDAGHLLLRRLLTCKEAPDGSAACKEVVLAWLSMAAELNAERTEMGERGISGSASMAREMTAGVWHPSALGCGAPHAHPGRPAGNALV